MKRIIATVASGVLFCAIGSVYAQAQQPSSSQAAAPVAGATPLGVTVTQMDAVVSGWSAKKAILGKAVYNDQNQKIGKIDDLIVTPSDSVSFAIIGAGGFLGIGKHDVAIPMNHIQLKGDRLVLPGATKDALKSLPPFEYARKK